MRLETYLNAFEKACTELGAYQEIVGDKEYSGDKHVLRKFSRQSITFKSRLLELLRDIDEKHEQIYSVEIYEFPSRCGVCGKQLQLARPGKWQCPMCG